MTNLCTLDVYGKNAFAINHFRVRRLKPKPQECDNLILD
jgi:hypothetical protein